MEEIEIRRATLDDITIIQQIVDVTWPATYGEIISQEQISYMLEMMYSSEKLISQLNSGHIFLLAEENGKPLGFAGIEFNHPVPNTLRLHKLYVLPEAQGKKIGLRLINEIVNIGTSLNQKVINLNVNKHNKAKNFYDKLGFTIKYEEILDIGNGYVMDDFVMEKRLKN